MANLLLAPPTGALEVAAQPARTAQDQSSVMLSLVIPTYNESSNVPKIVEQLTQLLDNFIFENYELILVDDNSPDLTWQVAQSLTEKYPQLYVMRREKEKGLSSAVIRGWQAANGSVLGVIDADLQHPPEILLKLLSAMTDGADLAVASRHVEGGGVSDWSVVRRFLSRGAQVLGLIVCPAVVGRVSDPMSGFFMVRRSAIAGSRLNPLGYKILLEVIGRGQIGDIAEVGYVFQERSEGESKVTWKQYFEYIGHLVRLRSQDGLMGNLSHIKKSFPTKRFIRYGIVGLIGILVDMAVLFLLHGSLGLGLTTSKLIAAETAIVSNFVWNDSWTFVDMVGRQTGLGHRLKRLLKFNTICVAGLFLDVLTLNLFFNLIFEQRSPYLSNLIAIGLVALWNFWVNWKLNWRVTAVS